jgi:membrane-bound serine protease (ClpP class)
MGKVLVGIGLLIALSVTACSETSEKQAVHVIRADGSIDPIMERFLDRALSAAEEGNSPAAVIALDTPGGLSSSMRDIVRRIERANVPVIVYVSPTGARAASAGTFITMAGHVAAMAPNTSIGAAAAIDAGGGDIEGTLGKKVENDAVAFIRGIAELRGRNADWAELAVREAAAVNQTEAVRLNVVDFPANDIDDLLRQSEGRTVTLRPGLSATLSGLPDAPRVEVSMTVWERILGFLADPTVASLLISLGFIALIIELSNPGLILPGTVGVVAIILGFLGFGVLPVDAGGLVLIALGLGLITAEIFLPGGILGAVGALALLLGGIVAFRDTPADLRPPIWLMALVPALVGLGLAALTFLVARARNAPVVTGREGMIGMLAVAKTDLSPGGYVSLAGERWEAEMESGERAPAGERVRIVEVRGLRLRVRKDEKQ